MRVVNSHVISNGHIGVSGGDGQAGMLVDGNEIAYNNTGSSRIVAQACRDGPFAAAYDEGTKIHEHLI